MITVFLRISGIFIAVFLLCFSLGLDWFYFAILSITFLNIYFIISFYKARPNKPVGNPAEKPNSKM